MKKLLLSALSVFVLSCCSFAWTCPTGQRWVQVPTGTIGGHVVEGITFQCQPNSPPVPPAGTTSNANASSSSSSTASSNSSSTANQKQTQNQTQTATGGNASATNGDQKNAQTTSYSSNYTEVRQTPMAYAPEAIPSAPCRSGFSGGASSGLGAVSLGGSKRDSECDLRETARAFALLGNSEAAARILCETKGAKKAKLTKEECTKLTRGYVEPRRFLEAPTTPSVVPPTIIVPAITVNLPVQPVEYRTSVDVVAPKARTCSVTKGTVQAKVKQRKPCPAN